MLQSINPRSLTIRQPCPAYPHGEATASHRQVAPGRRRIQRFGHALVDDFAAVHDVDVIRKLAAEVEILLDQQDRHAGAVAQVADRPADILDD